MGKAWQGMWQGEGKEQRQQQRVMCQVDLQLVILVTKTQVFRLNLYSPLTSPPLPSLSPSFSLTSIVSLPLSLLISLINYTRIAFGFDAILINF